MIKAYLLIASMIATAVSMAGDPALPGHHPLTQSESGSLLIDEFRCAACHTGIAHTFALEKAAPDLSEVGTRITQEYMQRFIESPLTVHPGTTMPDMLASKTKSEKKAIAESLTHFLVAQSKPVVPSAPVGPVDRQLGKELYHSVGCVACHGPKNDGSKDALSVPQQNSNHIHDEEDEEEEDSVRLARKAIKPSAVSLEHVTSKYSIKSLSDFLFQPLRVRASGRMPDMKLTLAESLAIAGYLIEEKEQKSTPFTPIASLVEAGKKEFQTLNCAACHKVAGIEAAHPIGALNPANLARGCLSSTTSISEASARNRSPQFSLTPDQISAIAATIRKGSNADSDKVALAKTLTAFRCIECHVRDDYGGVNDTHNAFFKGSQLNLGDDGRIPPPLTLMGAKLQPTWMKKVLFDGESVRNYMSTRMPQYGVNNLQHLPELFRRMDILEGPAMKIPNPESGDEKVRQQEKLIRAAGRELLGDKGANCVACHNFNGIAANVNQGIDLLTSYERLQPAWFYSYLQNPGAFRPRTVMPSAWPDGIAAFKNILDGNTDRQIEAIWYYLSLGTSAAEPSGLRVVSSKLIVGERASIHRGRSRVAGFRGIAVGLPEKLSYAFNAETGTLSAIWSREFINVNWSGQGSGDFNPASPPVTLSQDVSFFSLENENDSWPVAPVMTKEGRENPDPLYPKNVGYQFRGYYLDEQSIPTFQYRSGTIEIDDRSVAIKSKDQPRLKRSLYFDSTNPQTTWFRAMTGDIRQESDRVFRSDRLRLTIPKAETKLRSLSGDPKQSELLLRLEIPQGKSSMEFEYEPLNK